MKLTNRYDDVPTPCVGVCSTDLGDAVCRGCRRFKHEVLNWREYSTEHKLAVLLRLEKLTNLLLKPRLEIADIQTFENFAISKGVRWRDDADIYFVAWQVLFHSGVRLPDVKNCGMRWRDTVNTDELNLLWRDLTHTCYSMSLDYYRIMHSLG